MKPRSAKAKGMKFEKWIVDQLVKVGCKARKQPGSGIFQAFPNDVYVEHPDLGTLIIEAKHHKSPLATIRNWIQGADILVTKANLEDDPIVHIRFSKFAELMRVEEAARAVK